MNTRVLAGCLLALGLWPIPYAAAADAQAGAAAGADVLYTRDGEEYVGRLETIKAGKVTLTNEAGQTRTFDASKVQRVELGRSRAGDHWRRLADIDDPVLLSAIKSAPDAKDHPQSGYITLYQESVARLNADGSAHITRRTIRKVFKERGKSVANKATYYLADNTRAAIDFGRTVTPDGRVFALLESAIQDGSAYPSYPEYQNLNRQQAALRKVRPGAIVDFQVSLHRAKTDLTHPFLITGLFGGEEPVLRKVVRITVPPGRPCLHQADRAFRVVEDVVDRADGSREYLWTAADLSALERENNMPARQDIWPRLVFAPAAKWDDLARAYAALLSPLMKVNAALAAHVKALVKDCAADAERARAIHTFLVKDVRTIPVSFDAHRFVPTHDVNAVFEKRCGNDLEKSLLAEAMLRQAGLRANLCLVRSQGQGELAESVPSLGHFSDCLVRLRLGDEPVFLQVTDDQMPLGTIPGRLQNVRALVVDERAPALARTPLAPGEKEGAEYATDVAVGADGSLDVRETTQCYGQTAAGVRGLKELKDEELKRHFQERVARIHTQAELLSYKLSDLTDLAKPVTVDLHYKLIDYAVRAGDDLMIFRCPNLRYSARAVGKPTRVHGLDWTTRDSLAHRYTLRLPAGLKVRHLPKPVKYECPTMRYQGRYTHSGRSVTFEDEYRRDCVAAPRTAYAAYKEGIETRARFAREWIVLER